VAYTEDSYNVYGAGTSEVNGLYVRNGDMNGSNAYTMYDSDGVTELYSIAAILSPSIPGWKIVPGAPTALSGDALYDNPIFPAGTTPPEGDWQSSGDGEDPAPIVQATSEIGEYIGHWDGELWTCADSQRGQAYPDHNGIKIANCNHGDTVWVAYKKEFTDTYGDGENGTVSDIPAEWIEFMSYDAARAYAASQGNQDGYNPVAIRDVDRALERALMKVSRQGINETIALYFRTNYGYDVSVN
jgi:hypothetical protein